ncbi:MAG: hypothetical protein AAGE76_08575 [Pseudomonadota bacterium]
MRMAIFAALAVLVPAAPAPAQTEDAMQEGREQILIDLIRDNKCAMTGSESSETFEPMGYSYEEVNAILDKLVDRDLAERDGDAVVLSQEFCEAEG